MLLYVLECHKSEFLKNTYLYFQILTYSKKILWAYLELTCLVHVKCIWYLECDFEDVKINWIIPLF